MDQSLDLFLEEQITERDDNDSQAEKDRIKAEHLARQDTEARRHVCEVVSIGRMFQEKGADAVRSYLLKVEKARGSAAAERLRNEVWQEIQKTKGS